MVMYENVIVVRRDTEVFQMFLGLQLSSGSGGECVHVAREKRENKCAKF